MVFEWSLDSFLILFNIFSFILIYLLIFLHFLVALSSSGITLKGRRKRQALHRGVMQKHIMTLAFHPCVFALKTWQMETRTLGDFTAEIKGGFSLYKTFILLPTSRDIFLSVFLEKCTHALYLDSSICKVVTDQSSVLLFCPNRTEQVNQSSVYRTETKQNRACKKHIKT